MARMPRIVAIISIAAGVVMIVLGAATYYLVHRELADEHIVVSSDASHLAGKKVGGPFTAYEQAMTIKKHALEIGGGKTYSQLPQNDPKRDTVMNASFLRASLFTSVVSFGVAALVVGLGVLFILLGIAFLGVLGKLDVRKAGEPPPDAQSSDAASPSEAESPSDGEKAATAPT
jgi:cytochrome c biogenesis protein CcdA